MGHKAKIKNFKRRLTQLKRRLFRNQGNGGGGPFCKRISMWEGNRTDAEQQGSQLEALKEAVEELRDQLRTIRGVMNVVVPLLDGADSKMAKIERQINRMTAGQGNVNPAQQTAPSSTFGYHPSLEQRRFGFGYGQPSAPPTTHLPTPAQTSSGFTASTANSLVQKSPFGFGMSNYATNPFGQRPCSTAHTTKASTATAFGQPSAFGVTSSPSRSDLQPRRVTFTSATGSPFQNQNPSPLSLYSYPGNTSPAATATVVTTPSTNERQVPIGRSAFGSPPGFPERASAVPSAPPTEYAFFPIGLGNGSPSVSETASIIPYITHEAVPMLGSTIASNTSRIASTNQAATPSPGHGDR